MTQRAWLFLFLLLFSCLPADLWAQQADFAEEENVEDMIIYNRERSGIIQVHSLGYGIAYRPGKNPTAFKTYLWNLELITMKSPKQIKVINPYYNNSKRYVYGKLNDVFMLRAGYGLKKSN